MDQKGNNNHKEIEKRLWDIADELRANSKLKASEYATPVLGLIFLKFADFKFQYAADKLAKEFKKKGKSVKPKKLHFQAKGILFIPEEARFSNLINIPEGSDIGSAVNKAMKAVEDENEKLKDTLPKNFNILENDTLFALLKLMSSIPMDIEGDVFGKIYEYFLGKFALAEGQKGGEFFTPTSLVKLIVEVIEPYHGRILDPACGSGGMFVQSAAFVKRHKHNPSKEISIYGQESTNETVKLCKLNLAVHGVEGVIKTGNTYYDDLHNSIDKFDFVMANPPFNVKRIDKEKIKDDPRFKFGLPKPNNGNYIWIQIFLNALNKTGRAGFVMANSAADARQSEMEIRKKIVDNNYVDVMITIGPNFFYNVTLPCMLYFFDKGKTKTKRKDKVLFIDAREIYKQVDRAHREFTPEHIEFISNIVRMYRGEPIEKYQDTSLQKQYFPKGKYIDIPGLCKITTLDEIREQGYSLNPGRYVGIPESEEDDYDFKEKITELHEELKKLNKEAHKLEKKIDKDIKELIDEAI